MFAEQHVPLLPTLTHYLPPVNPERRHCLPARGGYDPALRPRRSRHSSRRPCFLREFPPPCRQIGGRRPCSPPDERGVRPAAGGTGRAASAPLPTRARPGRRPL